MYPFERVFLAETMGKDDQCYALGSQARCYEILGMVDGNMPSGQRPLFRRREGHAMAVADEEQLIPHLGLTSPHQE